MSFSSEIKDEMVKALPDKPCCLRAELYGILLLCHTFNAACIKIISEYRPLFGRVAALAEGAGIPGIPPSESAAATKGKKYVMSLTEPRVCRDIAAVYGYDDGDFVSVHLHGWHAEEDCCRAAFARGMFLAAGFAVDPVKEYHLEFMTPRAALSREISALLVDCGLPVKNSRRGGNYVLYYKESEHIEDFLTFTGAPRAALAVMEAKVEKNLKNKINRQVNCEAANYLKSLDAALGQVEAINRLEEDGRISKLPENLRETARLRKQYPELPLSALAALTPGLSRSGLNYRLKKIMEFEGKFLG